MTTQAALAKYIEDELAKGRKAKIDYDEDLLSEGIIDSLGILQLVAFIEDAFGVVIPDEDVVLENFMSVNALTAYLESQKTA